MQRSRIAVAAAVAAAVGAAVAFTLPSMAETTSSAGTGATTKSDVAPEILSAMERDLGLDSDQATTRLARSEWASKVTAKLSAETGSDYGGAWLAADGTTLKVAVTDEDAADTVREAGGEPVMVERSEQTLVTAKEKLDAAEDDADDVTGWYVDVKTNKLVVVAEPGAAAEAEAFTAEAGVKSDAVTVTTSSAQPKTLVDIRGADAYFIALDGGVARCSIGFSVEGGFVTAGHCGSEGDQTFADENGDTALGTVEASVFPGDADMGFVATNDGFTPQPVVNDFDGNELPVAGSTESPVGAAVCRSGSTTGTRCGTILAKNETVRYPEGTVTGLTRTDVCAEGGDSGGPWLSDDQAQGVTSGGSGDCTVGGETFFQPVNEILATNDLTLVTSDGGDDEGGGEETTPPTTEPTTPPTTEPTESPDTCDDEQVQRSGNLRSGSAQAQPNGGAFRANAGQQTACLDAPDGTDFDLVLQRLSNRGFRTVAQATGDGDKTLSANLRSGTYRYVVVASSGSGSYTLGFSTP